MALDALQLGPKLSITVDEPTPVECPVFAKQGRGDLTPDALGYLLLVHELPHFLLVGLRQHRADAPSAQPAQLPEVDLQVLLQTLLHLGEIY